MLLFPQYLVGIMNQTTGNITEETADLLEGVPEYMPGEEPVVLYRKSRMIFFAYFIPIIFLILGVIVFMGAVIEKFKKHEKEHMNPKIKNYGTCHSRNMRLFQHSPPSTTRIRSLSEGDTKANETLKKELEKRLQGDNIKVFSFKSKIKRGKKNKKINIVHIP